jgi:hypothetical protein
VVIDAFTALAPGNALACVFHSRQFIIFEYTGTRIREPDTENDTPRVILFTERTYERTYQYIHNRFRKTIPRLGASPSAPRIAITSRTRFNRIDLPASPPGRASARLHAREKWKRSTRFAEKPRSTIRGAEAAEIRLAKGPFRLFAARRRSIARSAGHSYARVLSRTDADLRSRRTESHRAFSKVAGIPAVAEAA